MNKVISMKNKKEIIRGLKNAKRLFVTRVGPSLIVY